MTNRMTVLQINIFALLVASCSSALALEGRIVEVGANRPVPGAFIVATWIGEVSVGVQRSSRCYHIEIVESDERGEFRVSDFSGNLNPFISNRRRGIDAYAPGWSVQVASETAERIELVTSTRTGTKEEQFAQVHMPSTFDCLNADDRRLLPLYRALHRDLSSVAVTISQKKSVLQTLKNIESVELGEDVAARNYARRLTELVNSGGGPVN